MRLFWATWPDGSVTIKSLPSGQKNVTDVSLLGHDGSLMFTQDGAGLTVKLPTSAYKYAFTLRIGGAAGKWAHDD